MPISIASAPAATTARTTSSHARAEPAGDVRDEQRTGRRARRSRRCASSFTPSGSPVSRSATYAASLSPRPERVTSTVAPAGTRRPASRASQPMACAGSSAGTMPSVLARSSNPCDRLVVGRGVVLGAARGGERGVLRADARVVEAGADRVRLEDLAVLVLEEQRPGAVQHAGDAAGHRRAVLARLEAEPARLDADEARRRCRGSRRRCRWRSSRRRRTRRRRRGRRRAGRGTARGPRRRRRAGTRGPSTGTGAGRRPSRCSSGWSRRSRPSRAAPR